MKLVKTEEAIGCILCHDITQIIKDEKKGTLFKKGHVIRKEDIPLLLSVGKDNIYIWENQEGMLHENEAAEILCEISKGENLHRTEVKEGKIELIADLDGLLKINRTDLKKINHIDELMIASRHGDFRVNKGDKIAGTRVIPLVIKKEKLDKAKALVTKPIFNIIPFKSKKVGIITTGNEVYYGRIKDTFTPVLIEKLEEFDTTIIKHEIVNDDHEKITNICLNMIEMGAELILISGGMSVDPDDKTPLAIKNTGANIISYGSPVLPGAMFLLSYFKHNEKNIPICGLPGCVMYSKKTIFDLVLPRLMADDYITKNELANMGEGGLCLDCPICTFPNCGFGKGV